MSFSPNEIIFQLEQNQQLFKSLLSNKSIEATTWKQSAEKWCLLEIVCHLLDEEIYDFRTRVKTTLEKPNVVPPPIDPVAWVTERKYLEQDYNSMLQKFLTEREDSILYLKSLIAPNWDNSYEHSDFGKVSAGFFLTNWLAHDQLHIKQITRLQYDYITQLSDSSYSYAGKWT